MTSPFIPISGSSPGGGHYQVGPSTSISNSYRKNSFSGASPGSAGGSGGGGGGGGSRFGGRARDILREAKEVLNRLKWDVAEGLGVDFAKGTQVYVSTIRQHGGGDEMDVVQQSWCRQWVREGRCGRKQHCRCTHGLTLAPLGSKPSLKSSGTMAPLQVLEGDELEAAMGTVASCGSGGSFPSSSYFSSSPSGIPPLYRAVFVVFDGQVVWDKERAEVWEGFLSSFSSEGSTGANGTPTPALLRRKSSIDMDSLQGDYSGSQESEFVVAGNGGGGGGGGGGGAGNRLLNDMPADVSWELLTQYLEPADYARCLATCQGWAERAGDEGMWLRFLIQKFGLSVPPRKSSVVVAKTDLSSSSARRLTTDRVCCDLSSLALQDDEELLAAAAAAAAPQPPPLAARATPPPVPRPPPPSKLQENILHTSFYHPRREYARLSHICRNAQALNDWSGGVVGGSGKQGVGQSASGSNGGGGGGVGIFSSSPSVVYSSSPQINGTMDLLDQQHQQQQLQSPASSSLPSIIQPPPPRQHVVQRFHGHDRGAVIALHVDEGKNRLISADVAGCVRLWELHSGARLGMVDLRMHITCLTADARTIYVGTVKGTLHTINRDDMADVQAHKLLLGPQQASSISSLCVLDEMPRPSPRRSRGMSSGTPSSCNVVYGCSARSEDSSSSSSSNLLRTPSPIFIRSGTSANKAVGGGTRGGDFPLSTRRTPSPESKSGRGEDEVRARLVIGFGNGSFMLLYGTQRLMHVQAPCASSSSTSSASFLPTAPLVFHHLYSLPISHPSCVFLTATGPRSFAAAACPDRLFLWSAADEDDGQVEEDYHPHSNGGMGMPPTTTTEIAVLPLTSAFSKGVRPRPVVGQENEDGDADALEEEDQEDADDDDDVTGLGLTNRHSLDECCDVAILALLPSCAEEEEEMGVQANHRPTLIVTACNHDVSLRWWELNPANGGGLGGSGGKKRRHSRATCTAITPAFASPSDGKLGSTGTLSLAQTGGVLLSAHLDGSLVVWHVGQRRPVAHFKGLPVLESLRLTPQGMDLLTCFERYIVYARETALAVPTTPSGGGGGGGGGGGSVVSEEDGGDTSGGSGRRRDRDKSGSNGGGGGGGGRPRRKNSFAS